MKVREMLEVLGSETVKTWFDLGLYVDRFREDRQVPAAQRPASFQDFCANLAGDGIAFITFAFGANEISRAAGRCASMFEQVLGDVPVHFIAGAFQPTTVESIASSSRRQIIGEIQGFENWPLYHDFFYTRLERGSAKYNRLIGTFWDEVLNISRKLGEIVQTHNIRLLYLLNVCSLPGNVSLSLAAVLVSEHLGIPVISHCQDHYTSQQTFQTNAHLGEFFSQIEVLFPWESRSWMTLTSQRELSQYYIEIRGHNPANVGRIPQTSRELDHLLSRLYLQLTPNDLTITGGAVDEYRSMCSRDLDLLPRTRHYLPGYGRTGFMLFLKSLIDPSYFRVEEQQTRGMLMRFAQELVMEHATAGRLDPETRHRFYNAVDSIFLYRDGAITTRHDHSFAYRHRNTRFYPYQDLTRQELTGLVNLLFHQVIVPVLPGNGATLPVVTGAEHRGPCSSGGPSADWDPATADLDLDDRAWLVERLASNTPLAYFPGEYNKHALEYLVLGPVRDRLALGENESITGERLAHSGASLARVSIFCPDKPCRRRLTVGVLDQLVANGDLPELSLLVAGGICQIIPTEQWCVGIHFPQLGEEALGHLARIKGQGGVLVTDDPEAAMMTDVVMMDRFHIGRVRHPLNARIMGVPVGAYYVQFAPAGVRPTLAYPTPIQTAKDFSEALNSPQFASLCHRVGRAKVLDRIKEDAELPVKVVLEAMASESKGGKTPVSVETRHVGGLYQDGRPWSGVWAQINVIRSKERWRFAILTENDKTRPVTDFAHEFEKGYGEKNGHG